MDALVPLVVAVVGGIGGYVLGNRRLKYEHLHERRAGVIARLCELLATVQHGVLGFTDPFQSGGADREAQAREAQRSFIELVDYYRANEVWLDPDTCKKIESFLTNVHLPLGEYFDDLDERGYPKTSEGRSAATRIIQETQPLRRELIDEFRAILYPSPWYDAPLRLLARLPRRNRKDDTGSGEGN
jgi:hypothetical protein